MRHDSTRTPCNTPSCCARAKWAHLGGHLTLDLGLDVEAISKKAFVEPLRASLTVSELFPIKTLLAVLLAVLLELAVLIVLT